MSAPAPAPTFDKAAFLKQCAAEEKLFSGTYSQVPDARRARNALAAALRFHHTDLTADGVLSTEKDKQAFFRAAIVFLSGPALTHARETLITVKPNTVDTFLSIIDKRFLPPNAELLSIDQLLGLRQRPGTSLQDYSVEFDSLAAAVPNADRPTPAFLSRMWIRGLADDSLRRFLHRSTPAVRTIPELLARAHTFASSALTPSPASLAALAIPQMRPQTGSPATPQPLVDRALAARVAKHTGRSVAEVDALWEGFKCFTCGKAGHLSRRCPDKPAKN